jgi:hypothetical protein
VAEGVADGVALAAAVAVGRAADAGGSTGCSIQTVIAIAASDATPATIHMIVRRAVDGFEVEL